MSGVCLGIGRHLVSGQRSHQQASADDVGGLGVGAASVGELDAVLIAPTDDVHQEQLRSLGLRPPCEDICGEAVAFIRYVRVRTEVGIGCGYSVIAFESACGGDHRGAGGELDVQAGDGVALIVCEVIVGYPRAGDVLVAVDGLRLDRRVAHPGYLGNIAGERVYPVHLDEVLVSGGDGYAEPFGVYLREVYVSPVGGAECACDDRPAPCLGYCRAVGGRHPDHKAAVLVLRVSEAGDEKPAGSDPDVVKGHIVRAVDVCRGVLCDGYSENGAVGVQADEEVVPGQGRTVPDEGGFPVR